MKKELYSAHQLHTAIQPKTGVRIVCWMIYSSLANVMFPCMSKWLKVKCLNFYTNCSCLLWWSCLCMTFDIGLQRIFQLLLCNNYWYLTVVNIIVISKFFTTACISSKTVFPATTQSVNCTLQGCQHVQCLIPITGNGYGQIAPMYISMNDRRHGLFDLFDMDQNLVK